MSRLSVLGFSTTLASPLAASAGPNSGLELADQTEVARILSVLNGSTDLECTGGSNSTTMLTLAHPAGLEVIEVKQMSGRLLIATRGANGTLPINHPVGTCVQFQGNTNTPCELVSDICGQPSAVLALVECFTPTLAEKIRTDPVLGQALLDRMCQSPAFLAACLIDAILDEVVGPRLARLIQVVLDGLTADDQAKLGGLLADDVVNVICQIDALRSQLAKCLAPAIMTEILNDSTLLQYFQNLINQTVTAAMVVSKLCADPAQLQALANCLARPLVNSYAADQTARRGLRSVAIEVVPGTGLSLDAEYRVVFAFDGNLVAGALCSNGSAITSLATCIRPYLGIPPASSTGIAVTLIPDCRGMRPPSTMAQPPTLYAAIPDSAASAANISQLVLSSAFGAWPNITYSLTSLSPMPNGSRMAVFNSNDMRLPDGAVGIANGSFTANGVLYAGVLAMPSCLDPQASQGGG